MYVRVTPTDPSAESSRQQRRFGQKLQDIITAAEHLVDRGKNCLLVDSTTRGVSHSTRGVQAEVSVEYSVPVRTSRIARKEVGVTSVVREEMSVVERSHVQCS